MSLAFKSTGFVGYVKIERFGLELFLGLGELKHLGVNLDDEFNDLPGFSNGVIEGESKSLGESFFEISLIHRLYRDEPRPP